MTKSDGPPPPTESGGIALPLFPTPDEPGAIESRRKILTKALQVTGLALTAPLLQASTNFVRLPNERGMEKDEIERFRAEIDLIGAEETTATPFATAARIVATWANMDAFFPTTNVAIAGLKARLAVLGGANSVAMMDRANGEQWFSRAQSFARINDNPELISTVYYNDGVARLYWRDRMPMVLAQAILAERNANTPATKGRAYALLASYHARIGEKTNAVKATETAIGWGEKANGETRWDSWNEPMAQAFSAKTLARFRELVPAVEAATTEALKGLPTGFFRLAAHTKLSLADAYIADREFDGAYETMDHALKVLPAIHRDRSIVARVFDAIEAAEDAGARDQFASIRLFFETNAGDPRAV